MLPVTLAPYHHQHHHNYLNCAAPKAKIAQNCNLIREIQNNYPPYPSQLGYYGNSSSSAGASPQHQSRPTQLKVQIVPPPDKLKKHPGILKNYKSCPVSPVHEELDWARVHDRTSQIKFNETSNKRHTVYSDDAQTILDMIQTDTEKMIAEITLKYGDFNDFETKPVNYQETSETIAKVDDHKFTAKKERHEHDFLSDEEGNFSSDSLEDCSLDFDCDEKIQKQKKKTLCKKHHKRSEPSPPKRSVSEYFIYEDYFTRMDPNRKVSLQDILQDDLTENKERKFLEAQRHSSASFFLGHYPDRKSQESILSDDFGGAVSFCNSMESILSDESECKSAPLEALFEKGRLGQRNIGSVDYFDSKSYGSSPNANQFGFDYYMQNKHNDVGMDITNYGFDSLDGRNYKVLKSPPHRPICTSFSVPQFTNEDPFNDSEDFIPSLNSKIAQYNTNLNKSLSKDFANQRKNLNPMHEKVQFAEPKPIIRSDIFADAAISSLTSVMKKSCSFEIDMGNGQRKIVRNSKKFEQNLQRFEKDRQEQQEQKQKLQKSDYNLEMDYVPHKPPVAHRRSSSMKGRGKGKVKDRCSTGGQLTSSKTTNFIHNAQEASRDFVNNDLFNRMRMRQHRSDEKSFEIYVAEKGVSEDDNMNSLDSLECRKKKDLMENSIDSLDFFEPGSKKLHELSGIAQLEGTKFITDSDLGKFRDIERKIDVINKLVELEERKLEQERIRRENRIKPLFDGNTKERGFVKHLTRNFDALAKSTYENNENWCLMSGTGMKRNYSLPDVLEGAKFQVFEFDDIDEPKMENYRTNMKLYDFDDDLEGSMMINKIYKYFTLHEKHPNLHDNVVLSFSSL